MPLARGTSKLLVRRHELRALSFGAGKVEAIIDRVVQAPGEAQRVLDKRSSRHHTREEFR
jgi:hypothetical protein